MFDRLKSYWLSQLLPVQEGQQLAARLLQMLLLVNIGGLLVILVPLFFMQPVQWAAMLAVGTMLLVLVGNLFIARHGHTQLAALLLTSGIWLVTTLLLYVSQGLHSPAYTGGYLMSIILASLLLGNRAGLATTALTVLVTTFMLVAEASGLLPDPLILYPPIYFVAILNIVFFLSVALLLYLTMRTVQAVLGQVSISAQQLAQKNEQLETAQVSLESRRNELAKAYYTLQQEVADRQQAEAARLSSEARYRQLVDSARDAIFTLSPAGTITSLNPAFTRLTGWPVEEWLNRSFFELVLDEDIPIATQVMRQVRAAEAPGLFELRVHTRADGYLIAEFTITPRYENEHLSAILGVARDITQRRKAEDALRQTQKLESLGVLAGGVAHDFNNLLVAMMGQSSLARAKMATEHPAQEHVEKAVLSAQKATELTRQLLAYSGRGQFVVRPLNLNTLVEENLHLLQVAIPKHVHLRPILAANLPFIQADAGQMQQLVMNLVLNGAEALDSQPGTVIVITGTQTLTAHDQQYARYSGGQLQPGQYVTLEVHDTGKGMDSEVVGRIFDPFFSTKATGHGLGLAAALGIVRGHGGGLSVTSEPGQGTTFKLLFPAADSSQLPVLPAHSSTATAAGKEGRILVIDDEEPVREAVVDIAALDGLEAVAAPDGETGIRIFREQQHVIKVVLLDLTMPGLNGEETFRELIKINPDIPIILSSGYNRQEATQHFVGKGLADFLQKPYDVDTLLAKLREHLP